MVGRLPRAMERGCVLPAYGRKIRRTIAQASNFEARAAGSYADVRNAQTVCESLNSMHSVLASLVDFRLSSTGALLVVIYGVVIGGAVGSFLNVVAYRLPLGMNLSRPGSRCPKCKRPIRPWHNVPVLGWLMLRGKCRDCGAPISPRYPIVELLVAAASAIVVWKSLVPAFEGETPAYALNVPAVVLRLVLVYLLFTSALLEFDGSKLPLRLNLVAALAVGLAAVLVPELRPPQPLSDAPIPPLDVLAFPMVAAIALGLVSWPLVLLPPSAGVRSAVARMGLLLLLAMVLGGLGVMFAACAAALAALASIVIRRYWPPALRIGWAALVLMVTLVWLLAAGPLLGSNELAVVGDTIIIPGSPWHELVAVGQLTAALVVVGRLAHWLTNRSVSHSTRGGP